MLINGVYVNDMSLYIFPTTHILLNLYLVLITNTIYMHMFFIGRPQG